MRNFKQLVTILLALLLSLSFLQAKESSSKKMRKMPAPKADIFIVPVPKDLPIVLKYPAQVKPYKNVKVVSRVLGVLKQKYFKEGEEVKKGQLLYRIEDTIYLAKVAAAEASLKMSEATLDNASRNWKRVKKLYANKVVSQEKRDVSFASYNKALASLALSQAQLKQAQIDLDYTKVKAPIDGVIGLKKVDVGDFVLSNPPTSLVQITQNNRVFVEFSMPFSDYINIKNHLWIIEKDSKSEVSLEVDGVLRKEVGVIDFMDVNVNKKTSTVKIRAIFENSDGYLMAGSFLRVVLNNIVQKNVITIPQKAVLQNPLGTIVFIEEKGIVGVRPVVIGNVSGDKFIVKGGALKSGDRVIVNNFFRVKPGKKVIVDKIINKERK